LGLWIVAALVSLLAAPDLAAGGAGRDWLAASARLADPRFDLPASERVFERGCGVAAVGPQLSGSDAAPAQFIEQRQQVSAFVLVACREPDRERQPGGVDG
jgi:hypothetical protein